MLASKFILTLLICLVSSRVTEAGCPGNCEPNGKCVSGSRNVFCECKPGFTGSDCSFPYEQCPDGYTTCYNGAKCVRALSDKGDDKDGRDEVYQCDCSQIPDGTPFIIEQCENPVDDICEKNVQISEYAFCTNDGICRSMIETGEAHPGCKCPEEFEGRHCQYRAGTAPEEELLLVGNEENGEPVSDIAEDEKQEEKGKTLITVAIAMIVLGSLSFCVFRRLSQLEAQRSDKLRADKHLAELHMAEDMADVNLEDGPNYREGLSDSIRGSFVDILVGAGDRKKTEGEMA